MKANKHQKKIIHTNAHSREIKEEYVQWATGDMDKTSCNDLSFEEANAIIIKFFGIKPVVAAKEDTPYYWGMFTQGNKQHQQVLSIMHQLNWTKHSKKWGRVPNIETLGSWLQSDRAPVNKPLKKLLAKPAPGEKVSEMSKTITALNGIIKSTYK